MTREQLLKVITDKTNDIFREYQDAEGITDGVLFFGDSIALDELQNELADLIIRSMQHNKGD